MSFGRQDKAKIFSPSNTGDLQGDSGAEVTDSSIEDARMAVQLDCEDGYSW